MGAFIFALISGAAITAQAGSNSQLKQSLRNPMAALVTNYVMGLFSVILVMVFARVSVPTAARFASAPWWAWVGGLLGVLYGLSVVFLANRMARPRSLRLLSRVNLCFRFWLTISAGLALKFIAGLMRIVGCALMVGGLALIAKF